MSGAGACFVSDDLDVAVDRDVPFKRAGSLREDELMTPNAASSPHTTTQIAVTHFAGRAGDHNGRAMTASGLLAAVLSEQLNAPVTIVGDPAPALSANWDIELTAAMPSLKALRDRYESIFSSRQKPVTALARCAVALATLPVVAAHRPDAVVIWFDAHADLNTPQETTTGYLGGLALSGPLGRWDSGLGQGLAAINTILVGTRDTDPAEQELIDDGTIALVSIEPRMAEDLAAAIADRPVYVHIDCDVLNPGIVPTDYHVPGGMTLDQLHACAAEISRHEVIGVEIAELETDEHADQQRTLTAHPCNWSRLSIHYFKLCGPDHRPATADPPLAPCSTRPTASSTRVTPSWHLLQAHGAEPPPCGSGRPPARTYRPRDRIPHE